MQFNTCIDKITDPFLTEKGINLYVKRDDLIHPYVSGNKLYKLKYNVEDAIAKGHDTILTFGGAYSNHLVATAAYCKDQGLKCIGVVRGEELGPSLTLPLKGEEIFSPIPLGEGPGVRELNNPLQYCTEQGMQLHFVSREDYRQKENPEIIAALHDKFGPFYLVPEGGANALGVKGAGEILSGIDTSAYTHIMVACGTGTTLAGMILTPTLTLPLKGEGSILGLSVLKGQDTLTPTIEQYVGGHNNLPDWKVINGYHHGGYAKTSPELLEFIVRFKEAQSITLDTVYTGKLFFAIYKMVKNGLIHSQSTILAIHTGGISFS